MLMSLDLIDHNEPSLDVREFLSLGNEFPTWGGGSDPKSSSLDAILSHEATISARLLYDLWDSLGRPR
jgi:hypothetical protein